VSHEARYPRGHVGNKMPDDELIRKFNLNRRGVLSEARTSGLLEVCWQLEKLKNARELTKYFPKRMG